MSYYGEMSPADIAAVTGNNRNSNDDSMFGGNNGIVWLIALALLFRGGYGDYGGGSGGNGGGSSQPIIIDTGRTGGYGSCGSPCATQADLAAGFNNSAVLSSLNDIKMGQTQAINYSNQGFNGLNTTMLQGFNGVERGFCDLSHQLSDCCCDTRAAIKDVGIGVEKTGWNISKQISDCCCDLEMANMQNRFDAQTYNCNTLQAIDKLGDRIIGYMSNKEAQNLRDENMSLKLAASQAQQNAFITANQQAQTAELIRRLGADCPQPAYLVNGPTPVNFPVNSCGQVQLGGNCGGCGSY